MHNLTIDLLKTIKREELDRLITHHEDHYITPEIWKKQAEKGKVSKVLSCHNNGFGCYHLSEATTATAIDSPVAHAAVLDVDLNISRARGRTSKLVLL